MSVQGWNPSSHVSAHRLSEHSSLNSSGTTLLACRICDKIFLSTYSLIQHYESHQDEISHVRQNPHHRTNFPINNTFLQPHISFPTPQRYHPYYTTTRPIHSYVDINNNNSLVASTQFPTPPLRNANLNNDNRKPFQPITKQYPTIQPRQRLYPLAGDANNANRPMRNDSHPAAAAGKTVQLTGLLDESVDKRTAWLLSPLEKPFPNIIDLETQDEKHQCCNLDLTLKI